MYSTMSRPGRFISWGSPAVAPGAGRSAFRERRCGEQDGGEHEGDCDERGTHGLGSPAELTSNALRRGISLHRSGRSGRIRAAAGRTDRYSLRPRVGGPSASRRYVKRRLVHRHGGPSSGSVIVRRSPLCTSRLGRRCWARELHRRHRLAVARLGDLPAYVHQMPAILRRLVGGDRWSTGWSRPRRASRSTRMDLESARQRILDRGRFRRRQRLHRRLVHRPQGAVGAIGSQSSSGGR